MLGCGAGWASSLCAIQHRAREGSLPHSSVQGIARGLGDRTRKMIRFTFAEPHVAAQSEALRRQLEPKSRQIFPRADACAGSKTAVESLPVLPPRSRVSVSPCEPGQARNLLRSMKSAESNILELRKLGQTMPLLQAL